MRVLNGNKWLDGYLDYHRSEGAVRIAVRAWLPLAQIPDVFIPQPRSLRRILNYLPEIGIRGVVRKVRSRLSERVRDCRSIAVGLGTVMEADGQRYMAGESVLFIAPCHPDCVDRLVVPAELTAPAPPEMQSGSFALSHGLYHFPMPSAAPAMFELEGWNAYSGLPLDDRAAKLLNWAKQALSELNPLKGAIMCADSGAASQDRSGPAPTQNGRMSAVLFGYGNYAKVQILPNLACGIKLQCIHDVEPTQLGRRRDAGIVYDTCGTLRHDERYDVYFIAGYHHTHADLAVEALNRGGYVVLEKPVVTTEDQLQRLVAAMRKHPGRLFVCFQMRYNPLWDLARQDLAGAAEARGSAIHYHCIVYQAPMVRRHWYNWPNSRTRMLSNGCHWLDHFMVMNDYARPKGFNLWAGSNNDVHTSVELENGAVFGMHLTDIGSPRIGVQEHVELRRGDVTVKVENSIRYTAENFRGVIRRRRMGKLDIYARMYRSICEKIVQGQPGDDADTLERSCRLVLDLDQETHRRGLRWQ